MFECWSTKLGLFALRADAIPSDNNTLPPTSRASRLRMVLREREPDDAVTTARWITSFTQSARSAGRQSIRESVRCFDISTLLSESINRKPIRATNADCSACVSGEAGLALTWRAFHRCA